MTILATLVGLLVGALLGYIFGSERCCIPDRECDRHPQATGL